MLLSKQMEVMSQLNIQQQILSAQTQTIWKCCHDINNLSRWGAVKGRDGGWFQGPKCSGEGQQLGGIPIICLFHLSILINHMDIIKMIRDVSILILVLGIGSNTIPIYVYTVLINRHKMTEIYCLMTVTEKYFMINVGTQSRFKLSSVEEKKYLNQVLQHLLTMQVN